MDSVGEELVRLAGLLGSGDLTDEEFETLKAGLIGTDPNSPAPDGRTNTEAIEGSPALHPRHGADRIPALRFSSWLILAFNSWMTIWLVSRLIEARKGSCGGLSGSNLDACEVGTVVGASIGAGLILTVWAAIDVILMVVWITTRLEGQSEPGPTSRKFGLGIFLVAVAHGLLAALRLDAFLSSRGFLLGVFLVAEALFLVSLFRERPPFSNTNST